MISLTWHTVTISLIYYVIFTIYSIVFTLINVTLSIIFHFFPLIHLHQLFLITLQTVLYRFTILISFCCHILSYLFSSKLSLIQLIIFLSQHLLHKTHVSQLSCLITFIFNNFLTFDQIVNLRQIYLWQPNVITSSCSHFQRFIKNRSISQCQNHQDNDILPHIEDYYKKEESSKKLFLPEEV